MRAGETVEESFTLAETRYVRYHLTTRNAMARLEVVAEDDRVLATSRSGPAGGVSERVVAFVAPAGTHTVRITSVEESDHGRYRLLQAEARRPREDDARRIEAWELFQRGFEYDAHEDLDQPDELRTAFRGLVETFEDLGEPVGMAATWRVLGDLEYFYKEWTAARASYEQGLAALPSSEDPWLRAELLKQRLYCFRQESRDDSFEEAYPETLEAVESLNDPIARWGLLRTYAIHLAEQGRIAEALEIYEDVAAAQRDAGDRVGEVITLCSIGPTYRSRGQIDKAVETYRRAIDLAEDVGPGLDMFDCYLNLAVLYRDMGRSQASLRALSQGLRLAKKNADRVRLLRHQANAYLDLGRPAEAREDLEQALDLLGPDPDPEPLARTLLWLADTHLELGDLAAAEAAYRRGLETVRTLEQPDLLLEAFALMGLARVELRDGRGREVPRAAERIDEALEKFRAGNTLPSRIQALFIQAEIRSRGGELEDAEGALREVLDLSRRIENPNYERTALLRLARLARQQKRPEAALVFLDQAIALGEKLRRDLLSLRLRGSYLASAQEVYDLKIDLLWEQYRRSEDPDLVRLAWETHEGRKGQALLEALLVADRDDTGPSGERDRLVVRLTDLQARLNEGVAAGAGEAEIGALRQEIGALERSFHDLEWERESSALGEIRVQPEPLGRIQSSLEPGEGLVAFAIGEERSYAFLVTRDDLRLVPVEAVARKVDTTVDGFVTALRAPGSYAAAQRRRQGNWLYERLLRPLEASLADLDRLVMVPDRGLWRLPFDALEAGDGLLLERWSIALAPSAAVWLRLRQRESRCRDDLFVAFGDPDWPGKESRNSPWAPLPYARREAESLGAGPVYLGPEATESRVKSDDEVHSACRLHFATHAGVHENARSTFSGLRLAHGGGEDGELQVFEISELDLSADLVVLSACDTGSGEALRGEGMVGLAQAFFSAGARTLLVSLWALPDDPGTVDLMKAFYGRLDEGHSPAEALRRAKEDAVSGNPAVWSAFVVLGAGW